MLAIPKDIERTSLIWRAAYGLQAVDLIKPSTFFEQKYFEVLSSSLEPLEAVSAIETRCKLDSDTYDSSTEADLVACRIVRVLLTHAHECSVNSFLALHGELFSGLVPQQYAGHVRDYNISKPEAVLNGRSVLYAPFLKIRERLEYDFAELHASAFNLASMMRFVSNVWDTHPFVEGNTRTIAVFCLLLLEHEGVSPRYEVFEEHSRYFRNALVRASFSSMREGIQEDKAPLRRFFENLVEGAQHELSDGAVFCGELF